MRLVLAHLISSQHSRLIFYALTMNIGQAIGRNYSDVRGIGARITSSGGVADGMGLDPHFHCIYHAI